MPQPEVTVLMPCLDEAETVGACIDEARAGLAAAGIEGEILVADNGSRDGSQQIARERGARVVDVPVRGYGAALAAGIRAARGRWVVMGDADQSYDFSNLRPFVESLRNGADLVMGNRFRGGIQPGAMPWPNRYLGNPVLTAVGKLFFRSRCGDFHCGLRGGRRDALVELALRTPGMEFASEMVVKAHLAGLRVDEVPTTLRPDGRSRPPHLRRWRDGWRHLRFLLLFSPRWLFLYPGLLALVLGLGVGGWLLAGPVRLGAVTLDVHTLLYAAAAVLIGLQSVLFAVTSRVYAASAGLIPVDPPLERRLERWTLEAGIVGGGLLVLTGVCISVFAVSTWGAADFGDLEPTTMLRRVIPAVTAVVAGGQIVLASFFLGVLRLETSIEGLGEWRESRVESPGTLRRNTD